MADLNLGRGPGGGKGGEERPLQKCVVTHFAARGPEEPLEPWRGAAARAAGTQCESGGAARRLEPRKFSMRPRGTQGRGLAPIFSLFPPRAPRGEG